MVRPIVVIRFSRRRNFLRSSIFPFLSLATAFLIHKQWKTLIRGIVSLKQSVSTFKGWGEGNIQEYCDYCLRRFSVITLYVRFRSLFPFSLTFLQPNHFSFPATSLPCSSLYVCIYYDLRVSIRFIFLTFFQFQHPLYFFLSPRGFYLMVSVLPFSVTLP